MVKMDHEDWDCAETRAIGWTLSVLATVTAKIETTNLLQWQQVSILWPRSLQKLQKHLLDCRWRLLQQEEDVLPTIRMTLAMMFIRSSLEMVKMDHEDWDYAEKPLVGHSQC